MRLIDADGAYKVLTDYYHHRTEIQHEALKEALSKVPTVDAIDVVAKNETTTDVVRCKDCKHRDPEDHKCDSGALERAGCIFPVRDDYFCSCGERREDADN